MTAALDSFQQDGERVDHLELTQAFIDSCERAPGEDLGIVFRLALERLGFRYFLCCSHVDPLRPPDGAVILQNYPEAWVEVFSSRKLHEICPVFLHAERNALPFFWDSAVFRAHLTPPQRDVMAEAGTFGLAHGYTVPIHLPWTRGALRASCSVVPGDGSVHARSYFAVQLMALYLYDAASRQLGQLDGTRGRITLSVRERQCLELAAQGKSDWVIARVLGLSESTVHKYIERAKRRLGVTTRVQAIVEALRDKQISFGDVLRTNDAEESGPD
jgi:DNA-binding CsgD family transcriptional regulator